MPLLYQQNINENTRLGVWAIEEDEDFFSKEVCIQTTIRHPHKRLQHLAGRYLLKELYPQFPLNIILVADTRKPFLEGDPFHFSISHCGKYAAAIVSTTDRVGTDIEVPQEKIEKIQNKFLKSSEQALLPALPVDLLHSLTLCWSIKEAVFKWYGEGQVDFRNHMHIESISFIGNMYTAVCYFTRDEFISLEVRGFFLEGNSLAWVVSR